MIVGTTYDYIGATYSVTVIADGILHILCKIKLFFVLI